MGRHSVPDDDDAGEVDASAVAVEESAVPVALGRHAASGEDAAAQIGREDGPTPADRDGAAPLDDDDRATAVIAPVSADAEQELRTADLPYVEPSTPTVDQDRPAGQGGAAAQPAAASPSAAAPPLAGAGAKPRRESGTRSDLRLLRGSSSLRARCIAGVLVPFLVYTVVLVVMARTGIYLIWLWAPTVTAGVLVGAFLDLAHRQAAAPAEPGDDAG